MARPAPTAEGCHVHITNVEGASQINIFYPSTLATVEALGLKGQIGLGGVDRALCASSLYPPH